MRSSFIGLLLCLTCTATIAQISVKHIEKYKNSISLAGSRSEWIVTTGIVAADLEDVNFWNDSNGGALGRGVVLRTYDGGVSWSVINAAPIQDGSSFSFPAEDTAFVLVNSVVKTTDGGLTWFNLPKTKESQALVYTSIDMMNATHGLLVGFFISPGGILSDAAYKTTDGTNWNSCCEQLNGMLDYVSFQDEQRGFVKNIDNIIWLTSNGAVSFWKPALDNGLSVQDIYFVNPMTGYMVSTSYDMPGAIRAVLKSTDQGLSWNTLYADTLPENAHAFRRVWFQDTLNGYIIGGNGLVLRTRDGGYTWQEEESGTTNNFLNCFFLDTNNAILVGTNGTIARKGLITQPVVEVPVIVGIPELYPNPCLVYTRLTFTTSRKSHGSIFLRDISGATVRKIYDHELPKGQHQFDLNIGSLTAGLYFMHIMIGNDSRVIKLVIMQWKG